MQWHQKLEGSEFSSDATQVKMSRLVNTTNMIMKSEILVKKLHTWVSPTLIYKSLKFYFTGGDRKIIKIGFRIVDF